MTVDDEAAAMMERVKAGTMERVRFHVCYRCGAGPHNRQTLYRAGKSKEGETAYACAAHRGLAGMSR